MKHVRFFYIFLFLFVMMNQISGMNIVETSCDFKQSPLGISNNPHFGWVIASTNRSELQTAYRIIVYMNSSATETRGEIWDSEKVMSDQSINVGYKGKKLEAGTRYYWKAKVWDKNGVESKWSTEASFVTALFDSEDWARARWIAYEEMPDSLILVPGIAPWGKKVKNIARRRPIVPMFRKEFSIHKKIKSAFIFVSGLGQYKAYINGKKTSDDFLSPGWTHYQKTCQYNIYDITNELTTGSNTVGILVGNGFHNINNERYTKLLITYGMPMVIAKIQISYTDGSTENIVTGNDWKTSPSPITYSSIYGGEDDDARLEQPGWNKSGFDASAWSNALLAKEPGGTLIPETTYPVRVMETFKPNKVIQLNADTFLFDFGQNASGIIQIKVKGNKGDTIKIIPAELISANNKVNQNATGKPHYYVYVLKGQGEETWQPEFTYYGFRYVQITGALTSNYHLDSKKPELLEIKHLHTYNSTPHLGEFTCSNQLFNRIDTLIRYAIQSNFQSVITDCPHREKLGWLEQTYLMGASIEYNYQTYQIYRKLVRDMMDRQRKEGLIASIAPEFVNFGGDFTDSPDWGSAMVILPYLIYKWYGDVSTINEAWEAMVNYVKYLDSKATNSILSYGLGDWYDLGPKHPGYAQLSPKATTATAIYFYDYKVLAEMASVLGKKEEASTFTEKANEIKNAYNKQLFNEVKKVYANGSQTSMAMPLCVGLVDEPFQKDVLKNLIDSIRAGNKAVTAGDIGYHYLVEALTKYGQSQLVYEMNNRDDVPGYGYQLKKGATALTESWQALRGVSNNHLMLGHIMQWFYEGLGGINQTETSIAYKNISICPQFVGDINEVKASYKCPYGLIRCEWKKQDTRIELKVTIPANTAAVVKLPNNMVSVTESGKALNKAAGVSKYGMEHDQYLVNIGSGDYVFKIALH